MGFELSIDSDYFGHPKTLHLISLIGPGADVYPLRLWFWASKYARSGYLGTPSRLVDVIEPGIGWKGRGRTKGRLRDALHTAQFLESDGAGNYSIHDWNEGIGRQISLYERKKQKQRERYAEERGILPEDHRPSSAYPSNPSKPSKPGKASSAETEDGKTPPSFSSTKKPDKEILRKCREQSLVGTEATLNSYVRGWEASHGKDCALKVLARQEVRGRTPQWINDNHFQKTPAPSPPRKEKAEPCKTCDGLYYVDGEEVDDERRGPMKGMNRCPDCKKEEKTT